jgi:hypothetical protein
MALERPKLVDEDAPVHEYLQPQNVQEIENIDEYMK